MKKAMADYALGDDKNKEQEEPIKDKSCLFLLLDDALAEGARFCERNSRCMKIPFPPYMKPVNRKSCKANSVPWSP